MKQDQDNPYDALERIFHEPNRLAIMSAVCAADKGLTFNEIKEACSLTDGNLNRHLKVLEEAGAVAIAKTFVKSKPCTTVKISSEGLKRFHEYLAALSEVIENAKRSIPGAKTGAASVLLGKTVSA